MVALNKASTVPDLKQELDRKTFETIEWLFTSVSKGRITKDQFSVAIDALFMTVSGLARNEFIDLVTAAQKECGSVMSPIRRHFHHPFQDKGIVVRWVPGEYTVEVSMRSCGQVTANMVKEFDSSEPAMKYMEAAAEGFIGKGWVEQ